MTKGTRTLKIDKPAYRVYSKQFKKNVKRRLKRKLKKGSKNYKKYKKIKRTFKRNKYNLPLLKRLPYSAQKIYHHYSRSGAAASKRASSSRNQSKHHNVSVNTGGASNAGLAPAALPPVFGGTVGVLDDLSQMVRRNTNFGNRQQVRGNILPNPNNPRRPPPPGGAGGVVLGGAAPQVGQNVNRPIPVRAPRVRPPAPAAAAPAVVAPVPAFAFPVPNQRVRIPVKPPVFPGVGNPVGVRAPGVVPPVVPARRKRRRPGGGGLSPPPPIDQQYGPRKKDDDDKSGGAQGIPVPAPGQPIPAGYRYIPKGSDVEPSSSSDDDDATGYHTPRGGAPVATTVPSSPPPAAATVVPSPSSPSPFPVSSQPRFGYSRRALPPTPPPTSTSRLYPSLPVPSPDHTYAIPQPAPPPLFPNIRDIPGLDDALTKIREDQSQFRDFVAGQMTSMNDAFNDRHRDMFYDLRNMIQAQQNAPDPSVFDRDIASLRNAILNLRKEQDDKVKEMQNRYGELGTQIAEEGQKHRKAMFDFMNEQPPTQIAGGEPFHPSMIDKKLAPHEANLKRIQQQMSDYDTNLRDVRDKLQTVPQTARNAIATELAARDTRIGDIENSLPEMRRFLAAAGPEFDDLRQQMKDLTKGHSEEKNKTSNFKAKQDRINAEMNERIQQMSFDVNASTDETRSRIERNRQEHASQISDLDRRVQDVQSRPIPPPQIVEQHHHHTTTGPAPPPVDLRPIQSRLSNLEGAVHPRFQDINDVREEFRRRETNRDEETKAIRQEIAAARTEGLSKVGSLQEQHFQRIRNEMEMKEEALKAKTLDTVSRHVGPLEQRISDHAGRLGELENFMNDYSQADNERRGALAAQLQQHVEKNKHLFDTHSRQISGVIENINDIKSKLNKGQGGNDPEIRRRLRETQSQMNRLRPSTSSTEVQTDDEPIDRTLNRLTDDAVSHVRQAIQPAAAAVKRKAEKSKTGGKQPLLNFKEQAAPRRPTSITTGRQPISGSKTRSSTAHLAATAAEQRAATDVPLPPSPTLPPPPAAPAPPPPLQEEEEEKYRLPAPARDEPDLNFAPRRSERLKDKPRVDYASQMRRTSTAARLSGPPKRRAQPNIIYDDPTDIVRENPGWKNTRRRVTSPQRPSSPPPQPSTSTTAAAGDDPSFVTAQLPPMTRRSSVPTSFQGVLSPAEDPNTLPKLADQYSDLNRAFGMPSRSTDYIPQYTPSDYETDDDDDGGLNEGASGGRNSPLPDAQAVLQYMRDIGLDPDDDTTATSEATTAYEDPGTTDAGGRRAPHSFSTYVRPRESDNSPYDSYFELVYKPKNPSAEEEYDFDAERPESDDIFLEDVSDDGNEFLTNIVGDNPRNIIREEQEVEEPYFRRLNNLNALEAEDVIADFIRDGERKNDFVDPEVSNTRQAIHRVKNGMEPFLARHLFNKAGNDFSIQSGDTLSMRYVDPDGYVGREDTGLKVEDLADLTNFRRLSNKSPLFNLLMHRFFEQNHRDFARRKLAHEVEHPYKSKVTRYYVEG